MNIRDNKILNSPGSLDQRLGCNLQLAKRQSSPCSLLEMSGKTVEAISKSSSPSFHAQQIGYLRKESSPALSMKGNSY